MPSKTGCATANATEITNDMALSGTPGAQPWFRQCGTSRRQQGLLQQFEQTASCAPARTNHAHSLNRAKKSLAPRLSFIASAPVSSQKVRRR